MRPAALHSLPWEVVTGRRLTPAAEVPKLGRSPAMGSLI